MNLKRLAVIMMVFAAGLMVMSLLVKDKPADPPAPTPAPSTKPAASQAATQATTRPTIGARTTAPTSRPTTTSAPTSAPIPPKWSSRWQSKPAKPLPTVIRLGSLDRRDGYLFQVELTNEKAGVYTVKLSQYYATVHDKQLAEATDTYDDYRRQRAKDPKKYKGQYSLLNPVLYKGKRFMPLGTRRMVVSFPNAPKMHLTPTYWQVVPKDKKVQSGSVEKVYRNTDKDEKGQSVSFEKIYYFHGDMANPTTAPASDREPQRVLRIVKTYRVRKDDYTIYISYRLENLSPKQLTVDLDQLGPTGVPPESLRGDERTAAYANVMIEEGNKIDVKFRTIEKYPQRTDIGQSSDPKEPVLWIGHVNQYFGSLMYLVPPAPKEGEPPPKEGEQKKLQAQAYKATFYVEPILEGTGCPVHQPGVEIPQLKLEPGQRGDKARTVALEVFAGPKRRDMFTETGPLPARQRYVELKYLDSIDISSCWCAIAPLTLGMMWLLQWFSTLVGGNYGIAIFLLVLLVRIVLHPLARKSQMSMMKMQKLAPETAKLKEKYKDDKQTLNKEMMKLYKSQGATPLLGCLPMFLQMPIWIGLYTGLRATVELRHSAFLPVWIIDLAAPDRLYMWGKLPWIGDFIGPSLNLLPLLLGVAMFFQSKLNPQMNQAAATPEQAKQQTMMKWMMPAMMLFIFYRMPSGLNLYIMASTFAGVAEQVIIRKRIKAHDAAEAAVTTTVSLPGKGARDSRPKKPKGPTWKKG